MSQALAKLPQLYIFKGSIDSSKAALKNSLEPMTDTVIFSDNPAVGSKKDDLVAWRSDERGVLNLVGSSEDDHCIDRGGIHLFKDKHSFIIPPGDIIHFAYTQYGEEWHKKFGAELLKKTGFEPVEHPKTILKNSDLGNLLREPKPKPQKEEDDADKEYREWHQQIISKNQDITGFIVPQTRALFFLFSGELFDGANVKFTPPGANATQLFVNKPAIPPKEDENGNVPKDTFITVYYNIPEKLPAGTYTVEVEIKQDDLIKENSKKTNKHLVQNKTFTFKTPVSFSIENSSGSFDVIVCDPISVEEAMMSQFAQHFPHLLSIAHDTKLVDEGFLQKKLSNDATYPKDLESAKGLKLWVQRTKWTKDKIKFATSIAGAGSESDLMKVLGKKLWDIVQQEEYLDTKTQSVIEFAFDIKNTAAGWKGLQAAMLEALAQNAKQNTLINKTAAFALAESCRFFGKNNIFNNKLFRNISNSQIQKDSMIKYGMSKLTKAEKIIKSTSKQKTLARVSKAMSAVGFALSVYSTYESFEKLGAAKNNLNQSNDNLTELLDLYLKEICEDKESAPTGSEKEKVYFSNREAIAKIERFRNQTCSNLLSCDEEIFDVMDALADLALSICVMLPAGPVSAAAAMILVIKTAKDLTTVSAEMAGSLFGESSLAHILNDLAIEEKFIQNILNNSCANQRLLLDNYKKGVETSNLETQFRLRAEALNGLLNLLARAAMAAADHETTFLEKCEEYKIDKYIRNFILNDGWFFPHSPNMHVSLDVHWLYMINPYLRITTAMRNSIGLDDDYLLLDENAGGDAYNTDKSHKVGYLEEKSAEAHSNYCSWSIKGEATRIIGGGMYMLSKLTTDLPDNAKTEFQQAFPIQTLDSKTFEDFYQTFKPFHSELDIRCLNHTSIKYRDRGVGDADFDLTTNTHNFGWKPVIDVCNGKSNIKTLSPFHQIRVLIVLRKNYFEGGKEILINGIYPVRLMLNRTDGWDIDGPVYKSIAKRLSKEELLPGEECWEGHCGCIIYPFFDLLSTKMSGTKPMGKDSHFFFADLLNEHDDHHTAYWYYQNGGLTDMRYGFKVRVGNNDDTEQDVRVNCTWDNELRELDGYESNFWAPSNIREDYPVTLDVDREYAFDDKRKPLPLANASKDQKIKDEVFMVSKTFLLNGSTSDKMPKLFKGDQQVIPLISIGGSEFFFPRDKNKTISFIAKGEHGEKVSLHSDDEKHNNIVHINNFDWTSKVELIILVISSRIDTSEYEKTTPIIGDKETKVRVWRKVPFQFQIKDNINDIVFDNIYSSRLHYLGKIGHNQKSTIVSKDNRAFTKDKYVDEYPKLKPIIERLNNLSDIDIESGHVFASHVTLNYKLPNGKTVNSIRPIGKVRARLDSGQSKDHVYPDPMSDDYYERDEPPFKISICNIKGPDDIGLNEEIAKDNMSLLSDDFEFHVDPPNNYLDKHLPWISQKQITSVEEIREWMKDPNKKKVSLK